MKSLRFCLATFALFGCGDDGKTTPAIDAPKAIDAPATLGPAPALAIACADARADVYTLPGGLATMDDSHRGDVFHCAITESLTKDVTNAQIAAYNVNFQTTTPGTATSGFWTYRVAYRTERNTVGVARAEGDTAAILIIPEKPLAGAPLVVFGHGSVGVAPPCRPSHLDLSTGVDDQDYPASLMRLAGYGYTVIAPDYAGFAYGQPPGYFNAEDEAHAMLDATRAAKNLLPTMPTKVVFTGHSQGGHAALSAQTFAASYGMEGTLVGVAVMAPLWTSMAIWAAAVTDAAGLMTATDLSSVLYAMEYAYSAGELRDGAGHGVDVFQTAKQADAKAAILSDACYDQAKVSALGVKPSDFFDTHYATVVGYTCAASPSNPDCTDAEAAKWKARWISDRPPIDPNGAPMLVFYGGGDTAVSPQRAQCARKKIAADIAGGGTATIQYCFDETAQHRDIVRGPSADYLNKWIAFKAGVGTDPGACAPFPDLTPCAASPNNY